MKIDHNLMLASARSSPLSSQRRDSEESCVPQSIRSFKVLFSLLLGFPGGFRVELAHGKVNGLHIVQSGNGGDPTSVSMPLESIRSRLDEIPEGQRGLVKTCLDRNIGFCHDLLGKRDVAIACYKNGNEVYRKPGYSKSCIKYSSQDYEDKPFRMTRAGR
jgi:hypothetical protein